MVQLLTVEELAKALNVTDGGVRGWLRAGLQHDDIDGRKLLFKLENVKEWRKNHRRPRSKNTKDAVAESTGSPNVLVDIKQQELRVKTAQANLKELQYEEAQGALVSSVDALDLFKAEILTLKAKLEQLPPALAAKVYSETNQKKCQTIIEQELKTILKSISYQYKTRAQFVKELVKAKDLSDYTLEDET